MPMVRGAPLERCACDLAGPFTRSTSGHTYILTAICVYSKFTILVPLKFKTALSVVQALMQPVQVQGGEILPDNGGEFTCELLNEVCRLMEIGRSFMTAYETRSNGVCERSQDYGEFNVGQMH